MYDGVTVSGGSVMVEVPQQPLRLLEFVQPPSVVLPPPPARAHSVEETRKAVDAMTAAAERLAKAFGGGVSRLGRVSHSGAGHTGGAAGGQPIARQAHFVQTPKGETVHGTVPKTAPAPALKSVETVWPNLSNPHPMPPVDRCCGFCGRSFGSEACPCGQAALFCRHCGGEMVKGHYGEAMACGRGCLSA